MLSIESASEVLTLLQRSLQFAHAFQSRFAGIAENAGIRGDAPLRIGKAHTLLV
jgi:hypothetical protein